MVLRKCCTTKVKERINGKRRKRNTGTEKKVRMRENSIEETKHSGSITKVDSKKPTYSLCSNFYLISP